MNAPERSSTESLVGASGDIEALVMPVAGHSPSGINLEYEGAFLELERATHGRAEQQFGDTVIPGEVPHWPDIVKRAADLLTRSKDLRIAVIYLRAATEAHGLPGLAGGIRLMRELVARYWDTLHPQLDRDDEERPSQDAPPDTSFRINVLAALSDQGFLRALRDSVVARLYGDVVTVRDVEIAQGRTPGSGDAVPATAVQVSRLLVAAALSGAESFDAANRLPDELRSLADALAERVGVVQMPDLAALGEITDTIAAACRAAVAEAQTQRRRKEEVPRRPGTAAPDDVANLEVSVPSSDEDRTTAFEPRGMHQSAPSVGRCAFTDIRSRADAVAVLDTVCTFLERTEPVHPAPLLIRRAQALMTMDFIGVMRELAPESLTQIYTIAGIRPDRG